MLKDLLILKPTNKLNMEDKMKRFIDEDLSEVLAFADGWEKLSKHSRILIKYLLSQKIEEIDITGNVVLCCHTCYGNLSELSRLFAESATDIKNSSNFRKYAILQLEEMGVIKRVKINNSKKIILRPDWYDIIANYKDKTDDTRGLVHSYSNTGEIYGN